MQAKSSVRSTMKALGAWMQPQSRARFSLAALLGLAVGMTLLAAGAIGLAFLVPSEGSNWKDLQLGTGTDLAQRLSTSLRHLESFLDMIATQEAYFLAMGEDALDDMRARESSLDEIAVIGEEGELLLYSGDDRTLLKMLESFEDEEWLTAAMGGRVYRGEVKASPSEGSSLLIALPSGSGRYVAGRVNIGELWLQIDESAGMIPWDALLLADDGRVLAGNGQIGGAESIWGAASIESWVSGEEWTGEYVRADGESVVSAAIPVRSLDWTIAVERPANEVFRSSGLAMMVLIGGGAVALISLILGLLGDISRSSRMGGEIKARLENYSRKKPDPLSTDEVASHELDARKMLFSGADARESVLRRAQEYELTMSDLQKSQERYALAVRGANDGLWDWDLRDDQVYYCSRWKAMLGHLESEVGSRLEEWLGRVHDEDREQLRLKLKAHLDGIDSHFDSEHRLLHRDGYYVWVRTRGVAVRDARGTATRVAGVMTDITDRKRNEEQWQYDALHDSLTGLANRALFLDRLGHALERAKRTSQYKYGVLFLDLDQFKAVNDKLGHVLGDKLLIAVSQRLAKCLREIDTIARLGGDEFVILMEDIEVQQDATTVAGRIHLDLKTAFKLEGGHEVFTSTSIGVVLGASHYTDPEQVLRDADTALYRAKELGRARSAIFDDDMHASTLNRLRVEGDLRKSLEQQEIELIYDPIVSCADLEIKGMQALVQWSQADSRVREYGDCSSISEDARLLLHIGGWAIEEACRQRMRWRTELDAGKAPFVSIGLSGTQMKNPELVRLARRILRDWPTDARSLAFEVAASIVDEDRVAMKELLERLKSMGFQLHLTGSRRELPASALLKEYPFDVVKVGRWYTDKIVSADDGRDAMHKVIREVHRLGRTVLAEGIETEEHFTQAKELGCDYCQGSYISQKLSSKGVLDLINESLAWRKGLAED